MKTCMICNKEFKNLGVHMRTHVTPVTTSVSDEDISEMEIIDSVKITPQEIKSRIFKSNKDPDRPLSEFLTEYAIASEDVLVKLINKSNVYSLKDKMKSDLELAEIKAEKESRENKKLVFTSSLLVADILEKKYGYKCSDVKGPKNGKPKTWVMRGQD